MSLELYGRASSYNVQKVLWFLDELKLDYKHLQYGGKHAGLDTLEFGALNPLRKVPVLVDSPHSVWESNTILRYLAASYGADRWWGDSPLQRSEYERWMDWSIDRLEPAFVGVFWGYYRTPAENRQMDRVDHHVRDYLECLQVLDNFLSETRYVSGESISLSDICAGVFIFRLQGIGLDIELPGNVNRWYQDLQQRTAYTKWVMSDFRELKGRQAY